MFSLRFFYSLIIGFCGFRQTLLSSSLACKRTVIPLAVTVEAIQPITPRYRIRMAASTSGDKASPKVAMRLGTGSTLMSPCRWIQAAMKVISRRAMPVRRMAIPEASEDFIRNQTSTQFTVTVGGCSTITQRPTCPEVG
jgi:hypothetical protein